MPQIVNSASRCASAELGRFILPPSLLRPLTSDRTRQVNAMDFGISFDPTPRRSARNTPQPASQRRQSRTPLTARGALRRPSKTPSKPPNQPGTAIPDGQNSFEAPVQSRPDVFDRPQEGSEERSRKRRKLSSDQDNAQLITPATSQASAPSLFGKRSTSGRKLSALAMQIAEEPEQIQRESNGEISGPTAGSSPGANKENAAPGTEVEKTPCLALSKKTPRTGNSTIRSGQRRSSRSSSRQSESLLILSATGDEDSEDEILVAVLDDSEDESLDGHQEGLSMMAAQGELPDTTMELVAVLDETTFDGDEAEVHNVIDPSLFIQGQTETAAPRSANIKKKRSSVKSPVQQTGGRRASYEMLQLSSDNSAHQVQSEPTTPNPAQSTPHGHPRSDDTFYQPNHDEDETYLQPTSPVIPTPKTVAKKAPRKKRVSTKARSTSTSSSTQTHRGKGKSTTFPVLTHRLTNTSALPTITEEAEAESENSDTEPGQRQTFSKFHDRPTPNCVDVLAQFCREDIETAIENAETTANATKTEAGSNSRATLKRKRHALQTFASELETHLFTLSTAVEHRLSLEAQLKQSAREKAEMQARWMEVRRERERVATRMDEVRGRKEDKETEEVGVRELSERLWRTELEVERWQGSEVGEGEREKEGLEWKLRTVAEGLSARVGGGLLERVRGFNGVLEGVVGVLDRRRGGA